MNAQIVITSDERAYGYDWSVWIGTENNTYTRSGSAHFWHRAVEEAETAAEDMLNNLKHEITTYTYSL